MDNTSPLWSERVLPEEFEQALATLPHSSWSLIYATKFSILDAATSRYLPPLAQGLAEVTRQALTTGSVRYTLDSAQAGNLGGIELYELDGQRTELYVQMSPRPTKAAATDQQIALVQAQPGRAARRHTLSALNQRRRIEQAAHWRWRQALHATVLCRFLNWLSREQVGATHQLLSTPRRAGGRPRKQSNTWAYQQVHELGRDRLAVFREWLAMDDNDRLEDPKDSFKKAIRHRQGK